MKFKSLFLGLAFSASALLISADTLEVAQRSAQQDLDAALSRLSELRATVREEKVPASRQLNELRSRVIELRREAERAQRIQDDRSLGIDRLERDLTARQDEADYLVNLLAEYIRSFETRVNIAELQLYREQFTSFNELMENERENLAKVFQVQGALLTTALDRLAEIVGGRQFNGLAVMQDGIQESGIFTQIGPVVVFASTDSPKAGLVVQSRSLEPHVVDKNTAAPAAIRELSETGRAVVPLDSSLGNALALAQADESLIEHIMKGGVWIWPILTFAALALLVALFKAIEIYKVRQPTQKQVNEIIDLVKDGKQEEAIAAGDKIGGPFGKLIHEAVAYSGEDRQLIEEVLFARMLETQPKLDRLLPFIAVTAATAPLMGLLGTVTGMINTFKLITIFGTGDARALSSGISEALVTTEFGLIVAIPALILHAMLSRKAQSVLAQMEQFSTSFVNSLEEKKLIKAD
jgi:biopolymer transport protein ExbB